MNNKIQKNHLQKPAYIYLRQSSMNQVRHNQQSTERQYALRDKAIGLGWSANMIHILDGDLGLSGSQAALRKDFQSLVALVSMRNDHHEGYITWQEYIGHQKILESNRTNGEETLLKGPDREGSALLQGLLICGCCGRRLTVRYKRSH